MGNLRYSHCNIRQLRKKRDFFRFLTVEAIKSTDIYHQMVTVIVCTALTLTYTSTANILIVSCRPLFSRKSTLSTRSAGMTLFAWLCLGSYTKFTLFVRKRSFYFLSDLPDTHSNTATIQRLIAADLKPQPSSLEATEADPS